MKMTSGKKFLVVLVTAILLLTQLSVLAYADAGVDVSVNKDVSSGRLTFSAETVVDATDATKSKFTVYLSVEENTGFKAATLDITYDSTVIRYVGYERGEAFPSTYELVMGTQGRKVTFGDLWGSITGGDSVPTFSETGVIVAITFEVIDPTFTGETQISFSGHGDDVVDGNGTFSPTGFVVEGASASVSISEGKLPGGASIGHLAFSAKEYADVMDATMFTVYLSVEENTGFKAATLDITYDSTVIRYVGYERGEAFPSTYELVMGTQGRKVTFGDLWGSITGGDSVPTFSETGVVVAITFEVIDPTFTGETQISFFGHGDDVVDGNGIFSPAGFVVEGASVAANIRDGKCGEIYSGICGNEADGGNLVWTLDTITGELVVKGTGDMMDFAEGTAPWYLQRGYIKTVVVEEGVTSMGANAFSFCENLTGITIFSKTIVIYDSAETISETATIYGYEGSTAEAYAEKYDRDFTAFPPEYIRGDVNGDGKVDSDDAIYLLRHTMLSAQYPINQNGDMNGDGKVDSDDAIYLLRHTMLPGTYPLVG